MAKTLQCATLDDTHILVLQWEDLTPREQGRFSSLASKAAYATEYGDEKEPLRQMLKIAIHPKDAGPLDDFGQLKVTEVWSILNLVIEDEGPGEPAVQKHLNRIECISSVSGDA